MKAKRDWPTREEAMRFALWMERQPLCGAMINPQDVCEVWNIKRASAYRWLSDYRRALRWARA